MLSYMRRNAGSWIIKAMLIGIALTFVIGFGILPTMKNKQEEAGAIAKVGHRLITRSQLDQEYNRLVQAYQQMYKDKLTEDLLKQLNLKEQVLNSLINNALQLEEARKMDLDVTDEEIQTWIQSIPYFQRDGTFSRDQYLRVLELNRIGPAEFESKQREELIVRKVDQLVRNSAKVSDQELWDSFRLDKEKIRLTYLAFDPKQYEGQIKTNEKQLQEYFQKHAESYRTPEKIQIVCALFRPEDYEGEVQILTGDIEEFYDDHIDQYSHPEEVNIRHILLKATPNQQQALLDELLQVYSPATCPHGRPVFVAVRLEELDKRFLRR